MKGATSVTIGVQQTPSLFSSAIRRSAVSFVFGAVIEDGRAVLRAGIRPLAIERRRVVDHEEDIEDLAEGDDGGVERHLDDLGVAGRAGADLLVGGVRPDAAGVAGLDLLDAAQPLEDGLDAPETAARQRDNLPPRAIA